MDLSLLAQVVASGRGKNEASKGFEFMQGHGKIFEDIFDVKFE
jgi:hypothetical protein